MGTQRRTLRIAAGILLLIALLTVTVVLYLRAPTAEDRFPVTSADESIAHETTEVASPEMWENQRTVTQEGKDGVLRRYTYFHERVVGGKVVLHEQIAPPAGKPRSVVVSRPATEVVTVGTRKGARYAVNSALPDPQQIGVIGASGVMWIEATGTITFAYNATAGVSGNSVYRYYWRPFRNGLPAGALLLRVEHGDWRMLSELPAAKGAFKVEGRTGQRVFATVNDAREYFDDNNGTFNILIWPDGESPK